MGLPFSVLGKFGYFSNGPTLECSNCILFTGVPSVDKLATEQVYTNFFTNVKDYEEFHRQFLKFCSKFNTALPGKHYTLKATDKEIQELHGNWQKLSENKEKKKLVVEFLAKNVEEYQASSKAMMATGLVVPAAAVVLKKSGQKVPQLKKVRLDLVPNAVFVPTATLLSLVGVRLFNIKQAPAKLSATA